jgi:hypothetical protein
VTDQHSTGGSAGPSTDRHNDPVIDPTKNVLDLVNAANRRQDDLRTMDSLHVREVMRLRAQWAKDLRTAESARIDAIRQVDVTAVQQAATVAEARATALAAQVAASAEAMRAQVAATATAAATALASALSPIVTSIEQLRQAMYEAQGQKNQVVESQARGLSTTAWVTIAVVALGIFLTFVIGIATIAVATHGFTK